MQSTAQIFSRRAGALALLLLTLSVPAVSAPSPGDRNAIWSELRSSPPVSCPQDSPLPRPLLAAAACGDGERVQARLEAGADPAATDPRPAFAGRTALHHAAQLGDTASVAILLDFGADPNAQDAAGDTPLHLLAGSRPSGEEAAIAKRLLAYGADARLKNLRGQTPAESLDAAGRRTVSPLRLDHSELRQLLAQAEATGPVRTATPKPRRPPTAMLEGATAPPAAAPDAETAAPEAPAADGSPESTGPAAEPSPPSTPEPEAKAEVAPKPEAGPAPEPVAKAEPAPEPKAEVEPAPKPEAKAEAAPEPKAKPAPEESHPSKVEPAKPEPDTKATLAKAEPVPQVSASAEKEVRSALDGWAAAWSAGNVDAYLAHYSREFRPSDGNTVERWREQRRARLGQAQSIKLTLSDVNLQVGNGRATVQMVQDYQSETFKVVSRKLLTFAKEARGWKIVEEREVH